MAAHQGLEGHRALARPGDDGLKGHPQGGQGVGEARLQGAAIGELHALVVHQGHRLALEACQSVQPHGAAHLALQGPWLEGLLQVADGPVLQGPESGVQRGIGGHQQHRHVQIARTHR
jgi:hypothetical protein